MDRTCGGFRVRALPVAGGRVMRPVHPPAVRSMAFFEGVPVVVELPDLVAEVEQRDAPGAEDH